MKCGICSGILRTNAAVRVEHWEVNVWKSNTERRLKFVNLNMWYSLKYSEIKIDK